MSAELSIPVEPRARDTDPFSPPSPQPAHFDPEIGAWVLSRYLDVLAALREPLLRQEQAGSGSKPSVRDDVFAALPQSKMAEWQRTIEPQVRDILGRLPAGRPVDLVREVIQPWTLEIAMLVLEASPAQKRRLTRLTRYRAGNGLLRKLANASFERFFRHRSGDKSVFIGISETLPGFLANAWLALLRNRTELVRLRSQQELLPKAIEELLRYAGLVHSLTRHATANVELAGVRIAAGDRVVLKLASANRDPHQFPDPDRLDFTRRTAGHLALGVGPHSCAGAMLLRVASAVATSVFVERCAGAELDGTVEWRRGSTLVSPATLPVILLSA